MERKTYKAHPNGKRPPFTFDVEGDDGQLTTFTCQGSAQLLDLMAFATAGNLDMTDPRGAKAIAEMFESTMGTLAYEDFKVYCRNNDVDPQVVMQILQDMVEYTLSRPLASGSSSADGPQSTGGMSKPGSFGMSRELSAAEIADWQRTAVADAERRLREAAGLSTPPAGPQIPSLTDLARGGTSGIPPAVLTPQGRSQTP